MLICNWKLPLSPNLANAGYNRKAMNIYNRNFWMVIATVALAFFAHKAHVFLMEVTVYPYHTYDDYGKPKILLLHGFQWSHVLYVLLQQTLVTAVMFLIVLFVRKRTADIGAYLVAILALVPCMCMDELMHQVAFINFAISFPLLLGLMDIIRDTWLEKRLLS